MSYKVRITIYKVTIARWFRLFFSELWDINLQLRVKSRFEGGGGTDMFPELRVYISQFWLYNSQLQVYLTILRKKSQNCKKKSQNCEFVSRNYEKKSQNCKIKRHNYHFNFFFHWWKRASIRKRHKSSTSSIWSLNAATDQSESEAWSLDAWLMRDYVSFKRCDHRSLNISSCLVLAQWWIWWPMMTFAAVYMSGRPWPALESHYCPESGSLHPA